MLLWLLLLGSSSEGCTLAEKEEEDEDDDACSCCTFDFSDFAAMQMQFSANWELQWPEGLQDWTCDGIELSLSFCCSHKELNTPPLFG